MKITINEKNAQAAYDAADEQGKKILKALFGAAFTPEEVDDRPITERVKTYEDACSILGVEPQNFDAMPYHVAAYIKLYTITEALNEGWLPQFTEDEYRYYPWFYLYTQKDIDDMDEDSKKDLVFFGGLAYYGSTAGLASAYSTYVPSGSTAYIGARLCFKTRELALYCGKQFADIWADFYLVRR